MDSKKTSSETLLEGMNQVGFKGGGCDDSSRKRALQAKIQVTGHEYWMSKPIDWNVFYCSYQSP